MVDLSRGIQIKQGKFVLRALYFSSDTRKKVSIKAHFSEENQSCAFIQFFGEFKPFSQKRWIIYNNPRDKHNPPYYSLSEVWGNLWCDESFYDLCAQGAIIFNTLFAFVDKRNVSDPKAWHYQILFGFSWGMRSRNGISIDNVPIKLVPSYRMQTFACLLQCYYPVSTFTLSNTSTTTIKYNFPAPK